MSFMDKAKGMADQAKEKAGEMAHRAGPSATKGLDSAKGQLDKATGGKYHDRIENVSGKVQDALKKAEGWNEKSGPSDSGQSGSTASGSSGLVPVGLVPTAPGAGTPPAAGPRPPAPTRAEVRHRNRQKRRWAPGEPTAAFAHSSGVTGFRSRRAAR